ncbi:MAG: ABC transporter permease [Gemmatimonadota bacterium]
MTPEQQRAVRTYRRLLRLYPAEFRGRFEIEMVRVFEKSLGEDGDVGMRTWLRMWADLAPSAIREHWDVWMREGNGMDGIRDDVRRTVRTLLRAPGFAATVVGTLGLGLGATAALFTVVDAVLLTPLPYDGADRIVLINEAIEERDDQPLSLSYVNGTDWQASATTLEQGALFRGGTLTLTSGDQAENLAVLFVEPAYFSILGVHPEVGRLPTADENVVPGGHPIAVVSHRLWMDRLGGELGALGSTLELSGIPYTVVGVMPEGHREPFPSQGGGQTDLWAPAMMAGQIDPRGNAVLTGRAIRTFGMFGRIAEGQTPESVEADLDRIADRLEAEFPGENRGLGAAVQSLDDALSQGIRGTVILLMGGALVLLGIACFNVVNLLLVRGSTRRREVSVQLALGAPRSRVARPLIVESVVLSLLGGALGIAVANVALPVLLSLVPGQLPVVADVRIDGSVLLMMAAMIAVVGVLVGAVPAGRISASDLRAAMSSARGGDRVGDRIRRVLVQLEVATATVLLVGAVLIGRGFLAITSSDPGFTTERVVSARVTLAPARYPDLPSLARGIEQITAAVEAVPGVEWATPWGPGRPGQSGFFQSSIPDGMDVTAISDAPIARRQHVGAGTLASFGIDVVAGRDIAPEDQQDTERVAVVSEAMAAELWPGQSALGQVFRGFTPVGQPHDPSRTWVVVGVAADAQHSGRLSPAGQVTTANDAYFPIAQRPERSFGMLVRMRPDSDFVEVREAIATFDPDVPVFAVSTLGELFALEEAPVRFSAVLMAFFGLSALALAGLGVYGVIAFSVSRQTREIGLRTALGASRGRTVLRYLGQGVRLGVLGVGAGTLLTVPIARAVEDLGAVPLELDSASIGIVALVLVAIATTACVVPALRASRIQPTVALREE